VTFRHEPGTGPALVCVHGSADNHHVYDRLLDAMQGRERYAVNLPGRAGTDGPALGTAAEMEAFLSRFLESEVKGEYAVVGHSLGAAIPPVPPGLYAQGADPGLIADASKHRELTPIETGCNDWKAADSFDRMQDLANIQVPALIVAGTEDALTPAKYAQYLAAQIPDNELHILAGAGHMLVMECAAEIAALITGRL